jgi:mono/diheme cytochrome c family protein
MPGLGQFCTKDQTAQARVPVPLGLAVLASVLLLAAAAVLQPTQASGAGGTAVTLNATRKSASDLEVGGELAGLPRGSTRYVALESLLALPQTAYTVSDDPDLPAAAKISGAPLEELAKLLAAAPDADMAVAICDDKYQANYPRAYVMAHHPLLVLRVNGQLPPRWPKNPETHGSMGPYMISQGKFTPSFKVLSQSEEMQIPWGVVRLEFRDEKAVLGAIAPRGPHAQDTPVQEGYRIAGQNCFKCHNMGGEGGQKSGHPWLVLAAWASAAPEYFSGYVRNPRKMNRHAEMPGNPSYDEATIRALREYFATFIPAIPAGKP